MSQNNFNAVWKEPLVENHETAIYKYVDYLKFILGVEKIFDRELLIKYH